MMGVPRGAWKFLGSVWTISENFWEISAKIQGNFWRQESPGEFNMTIKILMMIHDLDQNDSTIIIDSPVVQNLIKYIN